MSETLPLFLLHVLGFAGFWWLGLYALVNGDGGRIARLTALAALATACFFVEGGLFIALTHAPATVNRALWWSDVLPVALWLHLSLRLNPRRDAEGRDRPMLWAAYGGAALLIALGTATNLVNDYAHSPVGAGPAYVVYVAYLFLGTGLAVVNLARPRPLPHPSASPLLADPTQPGAAPSASGADGSPVGVLTEVRGIEMRLLVGGAICFLLGAGYLAVNVMLRHAIRYEAPGYLLLLAGLGAVGAAVIVRGALLLGKDVRRDASYSATVLLLLLALYLLVTGLLVGFDGVQHRLFALVLVGLIATGHTLYDAQRDWLDRLFFTPSVQQERAAARAYATALAVQPVGPHPELATPKAFDDAVRRALTHLSDPTKLATTPLLNLTVVGRGVAEQGLEDNRLNRAAVLKDIVLELLDGLRPADDARPTSDARRYYNCLYYPYVRGLGRRRAPAALRRLQERRRREGGARGELEQVLEWLLQVDEDTFYKWQRRGSDTIAAALREREAAAGGAVPAPTPPRGEPAPQPILQPPLLEGSLAPARPPSAHG